MTWQFLEDSEMRLLGPNALDASVRSRGSVAIVIVVQYWQPPVNGVSLRPAGYGWWAYASSFACAACMPRIHATGETPPLPARGAVTPPATFADRLALWSAVYAGFSSRVV